jgi:ActR/RegA family two-component response regulator
MSANPPHDEGPLSLGAQVVRALLERHGIAKHRHSSFVGEFFKLSRAAAHQRVNRSAAWTLEELQALASHFGERLSDVVTIRGDDDAKPATLRLGGLQVACRVWLDRSRSTEKADSFVASQNGNGPILVVPATAASTQTGLRISRIEIEQSLSTPSRVAVLDDELDVAHSLCEQLRAVGLEAVGFGTADELMAEIPTNRFDGYVIDWLLSDGNAIPLLAMIRAQSKSSAVVLLSGKMRGGSANPVDVASACSAYRVQLVEKPVQVPLILSALELDGLTPIQGTAAK